MQMDQTKHTSLVLTTQGEMAFYLIRSFLSVAFDVPSQLVWSSEPPRASFEWTLKIINNTIITMNTTRISLE